MSLFAETIRMLEKAHHGEINTALDASAKRLSEREANVTRREAHLKEALAQKDVQHAERLAEIRVLKDQVKNLEDQSPRINGLKKELEDATAKIAKLQTQACALKGTKCNFTEKK